MTLRTAAFQSRVCIVLCAGVALLCAGYGRARGEQHADGFDAGKPSWRLRYNEKQARVLAHNRREDVRYDGSGSEHIAFESKQRTPVQLDYSLPPARSLDELELKIRVRSNRAGAQLFLRVVFPNQQDPTTGKVLKTSIQGDRYAKAEKWQELRCRTFEKELNRRLMLLRARLRDSNLDTRGAYVDRAMLVAPLDPGTVEFFIDDLRFGPIVPPKTNAVAVTQAKEPVVSDPLIEFRLDRPLVNGRPFFPRIVPYHGERLDSLQENGVNVLWISDYRNGGLLDALREFGLYAMATPPRAVSATGTTLAARDAGLVPFTDESLPILFWYLGTRIPPENKADLISWNKQIRSADRKFRRPRMADVTGLERVFSRHVEMLGVSRHIINTTFSPKEYRDWLIQKRKTARPGSYIWTWIQTEPASTNSQWRETAGKSQIVVEPEQIRLQVYAALAAGCRGIGFWKSTPLHANYPGAEERRLILAQLNLELQLLEPWLATATLESQVPFQVSAREQPVIGQRQLDFGSTERGRGERDALLRAREDRNNRSAQKDHELEAAIFSTDYGKLLLPVWYRTDAQLVPDQMAQNDATIVVPGVDESAAAWEVSTTGVQSLPRERVTGGIKITLKKFNQTAAVVLTSDQRLIGQLRRKVAQLAAGSAAVCIDLAEAKLGRVRQVNAELEALGVGQRDAPQLLALAESRLRQARTAREREYYQDARELSAQAMQLLRILQRAHWNDAVRSLGSPASSPYTACFQTLADHWRMVAEIGRSSIEVDSNLLRSGDFEDIDTMMVDGWQHTQNKLAGVRATAELYPAAHGGKYSLRLIAVPETGHDTPQVVSQSPVTVSTPPVLVRAGQIAHISGWVRVAAPVSGSLDGAIVYDSQSGPVGALRFHQARGWQPFAILREIQQSGELSVTMSLTGLGEVQFDDLRIIPHEPRPARMATAPARAQRDDDPRNSAFDLFNRLPGIRPLSSRQ